MYTLPHLWVVNIANSTPARLHITWHGVARPAGGPSSILSSRHPIEAKHDAYDGMNRTNKADNDSASQCCPQLHKSKLGHSRLLNTAHCLGRTFRKRA
jgi:hypothetical protein